MKTITNALFLIIFFSSCSANFFGDALPNIKELNSVAKQQLNPLKGVSGAATEALKSTGVYSSHVLSLEDIEIERVFKQQRKTMLVAKIAFDSIEGPIKSTVIFPYEESENNFKDLIWKLISPLN